MRPIELLRWHRQVRRLFLQMPWSRCRHRKYPAFVEKSFLTVKMGRNSCCSWTTMGLEMSLRPTHPRNTFRTRTRFLFQSVLLLLDTLQFVVSELSGVVLVAHPVPTAFLMQNTSITDLLERISSGRLLIPSIEGLSGSGEARILPEMSELELSNLMINSN